MDGLEEELKLPDTTNDKPAPPNNDELPEIDIVDDEPAEGEDGAVEQSKNPDTNDKGTQRSAEERTLQTLSRQVAELGDRVNQGLSQQAKDIDVRISRIEKTEENEVIRNFKTRYDAVKEALKTAASEGDGTKVAELSETLTDMRIAWNNAERARAQMQRRPQRAQPQAAAPQVPPPTQEARSWALRNRSWFNAPGFQKETRYARLVDVMLEEEGYDKNSPEYFDEIDKRVGARYPNMVSARSNSRQSANNRPGPSAPLGRSQSPAANNGKTKDGRLQFTRKEYDVAKTLNIADDPVKLKEYHNNLQSRKRRSA